MSDEIRRSDVGAAQERYPILVAYLAGVPIEGFNADAMEVEVARALREIDTLTADLQLARQVASTLSDAVENLLAERDALRAIGDQIVELVPRSYTAFAAWSEDGPMAAAEVLEHMDDLRRQWRESSPPPAEGGGRGE